MSARPPSRRGGGKGKEPRSTLLPSHYQEDLLPRQHDLGAAGALEERIQVGAREAAGDLLADDRLARLGRQLGKLVGQRRARREERRARGRLVHNVHERRARRAVLVQQAHDALARGVDVGRLELAVGVSAEGRAPCVSGQAKEKGEEGEGEEVVVVVVE